MGGKLVIREHTFLNEVATPVSVHSGEVVCVASRPVFRDRDVHSWSSYDTEYFHMKSTVDISEGLERVKKITCRCHQCCQGHQNIRGEALASAKACGPPLHVHVHAEGRILTIYVLCAFTCIASLLHF
jgi:hypothetical protein